VSPFSFYDWVYGNHLLSGKKKIGAKKEKCLGLVV